VKSDELITDQFCVLMYFEVFI